MTITATRIGPVNPDNRGDQVLWKLSESVPSEWGDGPPTEFIVTSAIAAAFDHGGPECFIFPSDGSGNVTDWGEMPGSQRGTTDHETVIRAAGWGIA